MILYTPNLPLNCFSKIEVYGYRVCFDSKEALFLTKLGQLNTANRADNKRKRDLETIIRLREQNNAKKTNDLASKLPDSYWKMGCI